MGKQLKILVVAGARPNFMKVAPLLARMKMYPQYFETVFVHTGQHYDENMSKTFINALGLPEPDVFLGVGSASHAVQTANIMIKFENVVVQERPDWVFVVGDINSTIACALVAAKLGIPVAHIEAGLRSYDRDMPEEVNRVLTDQISDLLFITCKDAALNLKAEGIAQDKIVFVGNLMIESLIQHLPQINQSNILETMDLQKSEYVLLTLHRPSNVDKEEDLLRIMEVIIRISQEVKVVFPAHPRTQNCINAFNVLKNKGNDNLVVTDPLGYFDFTALQKHAKFILTDSGGIQEEATYFNVPCLTLRENTERPITVDVGSNLLIGTHPENIERESLKVLSGKGKTGVIPEYWDEQVSERIVQAMIEKSENYVKN